MTSDPHADFLPDECPLKKRKLSTESNMSSVGDTDEPTRDINSTSDGDTSSSYSSADSDEMRSYDELLRYQYFLSQPTLSNAQSYMPSDAEKEELRIAPLIWWDVKSHLDQDPNPVNHLQQYAILGNVVSDFHSQQQPIKPVLLNTNSPWSAFLCGSQGSGKSHTMSTMLENCLLQQPELGKNPNPLAALVLHYDGARGSGVCEAAYLCSKVKTTVLISASNYGNLKRRYEDMARKHGGSIEVKRLLISTEHLDTERVKTLMAVTRDGDVPLYIQSLVKIIREIAIERGGVGTFDYQEFKARLEMQLFSERQNQPLQLRIDLLESFLDVERKKASRDSLIGSPGELTIVDLTDPMVDVDAACVLFDTCLSIFLAQTKSCGKIVALDEAHNYLLDGSDAAKQFTGKLLKSIREQRHQGTRVIIATQEPTLDTKLLDLCSIVMVHRCTSPAWFDVLKKHIAGLYLDHDSDHAGESKAARERALFQKIVGLKLGESFLFCPSAAMDVEDNVVGRMLDRFVKFRTRKRCTADGGLTRLAEEKS